MNLKKNKNFCSLKQQLTAYNFAKINVEQYFADCIEEIGIDLETRAIGLAYYNYTEKEAELSVLTSQRSV